VGAVIPNKIPLKNAALAAFFVSFYYMPAVSIDFRKRFSHNALRHIVAKKVR